MIIGWLILLVLLYGVFALGFSKGKKVGAGAERWEFRQHAHRNGGYLYLGTLDGTGGDEWGPVSG